jgi:hypothetical protein
MAETCSRCGAVGTGLHSWRVISYGPRPPLLTEREALEQIRDLTADPTQRRERLSAAAQRCHALATEALRGPQPRETIEHEPYLACDRCMRELRAWWAREAEAALALS